MLPAPQESKRLPWRSSHPLTTLAHRQPLTRWPTNRRAAGVFSGTIQATRYQWAITWLCMGGLLMQDLKKERDMPELELHVVLGASGGVGNAVVRALVAQGKRVRGVTRSGKADVPAGVELVAADINNLDQARAVCREATVVYFCANPPYNRWPQEFPPLLEGAIAGASAAGAKLIAAANLYVYAPTTQPLTEALPWAPVTRKGKVRVAMDERLLAAHRSGEVQAAIGRASDFFGPGALNSSVAGDRFFDALLAGKSIQWIGRLDMPHTFSYLDDFGRGLVTLGARPEALGQSWHIPAAEPVTGTSS